MKDDTEEEKLKKEQNEIPNESKEMNEPNEADEIIDDTNEEDLFTPKEINSDSNPQKQKTKKIFLDKFDLDNIKLKIKPISIDSASGFEEEDEFTKKKRMKRYKSIRKIIFIFIGLILFYITLKKIKENFFNDDDNTKQTFDVTNADKSQVNTVVGAKDINPDKKINVKDDEKKI